MKKNLSKKFLSLILSTVLIVAMALCMTACGGNDTEQPDGNNTQTEQGTQQGDGTQAGTGDVQNTITPDLTLVGEGSTTFTFTVVSVEGREKTYEVHTDKTLVGEALQEVGLIQGEEGPYGLYVKTVDGVTLDYNKDNMYWSFYINDEYGMTGVDVTPITEGETYAFKAEES